VPLGLNRDYRDRSDISVSLDLFCIVAVVASLNRMGLSQPFHGPFAFSLVASCGGAQPGLFIEIPKGVCQQYVSGYHSEDALSDLLS
jgi:hypothetical protein